MIENPKHLIAEVDRLTAEFGDAELHRRNRVFDRQFEIADRRAAPVVAFAVAVFALTAIGAVVAWSLLHG